MFDPSASIVESISSESISAEMLAEQLQALALARSVQITTAESCTGGGVSAAITAIAGSSGYFEAGYVTYSNTAKQRLLGVSEASLADFGAVSEAVVREMVSGACRDSGADLGVAISGVAGPGGGSDEKPVGTVWLAWGNVSEQQARCFRFEGERDAVRAAAVRVALKGLILELED